MLKSILAAGIFLTFGAGLASAGAVRQVDSPYCEWEFSGQIEKGDAAKLDAIDVTSEGAILCLDSPGGSLIEGQAMFEKIWTNSIFTVVKPQANCLSACALAFLGGSWQVGTDVVRFYRRWMWPGARLGFHRPYLDIAGKDGVYEANVVAEAFDHAMLSALKIYEMNQTIDRKVTGMPDYLYYKVLATRGGPSSFHYVDTVGDLVMSDIDLYGIDLSAIPQAELVRNICDNAHMRANFSNKQYGAYKSIREAYKELILDGRDEGYDVSLKRDGDYVTGRAGPYFSGTKYYQLGCEVQFSSRELKGERDPRGDDEISVTIFPVYAATLAEDKEPRDPLRSIQVNPVYGLRFDMSLNDVPRAGAPGGNTASQQPAAPVSQAALSTTGTVMRGTCEVSRQQEILDKELCTRVEEAEDSRKVVSYVWPSGGKTVLVEQAGSVTLNGKLAAPTQSAASGGGECVLNTGSGNIFCFFPR